MPCTILTADFIQRHKQRAISGLVIAAHAALSAVAIGLFMIFPFVLTHRLPLPEPAAILAAFFAFVSFAAIYTIVRKTNYRYLKVVTIVPVVVMIGILLRIDGPAIDNFYSARPVAADLRNLDADRRQVAIFDGRRELLYGLEFYRNQSVSNYNESQIPFVEHLLIAKEGTRAQFEKMLPGRTVKLVGGFPLQHIDYYLVSPLPESELPGIAGPLGAAASDGPKSSTQTSPKTSPPPSPPKAKKNKPSRR